MQKSERRGKACVHPRMSAVVPVRTLVYRWSANGVNKLVDN
jgi:hypothetical protein